MTHEKSLKLVSSGDAAFDKILGGGIPERSIVVVAGEPGAGKTVLTLQMMFAAAKRGLQCIYFTTLSEPSLKLLRYMQVYDFFDEAQIDTNIFFADLGGPIEEGASAVMAEIEQRLEKHEPSFVAIDSFRAIGEQLADDKGLRPFVYDLAVRLAGYGATTLLVGEYARAEHAGAAEFAIADGILRLDNEHVELTAVRAIEVLKMRGAAYLTGKHFFEITRAGVAMFPRVSAPSEVSESAEPGAGEGADEASDGAQRVSTGIAGLDELVDGGFPVGSTTLVEGGSGTGKTLIGLQYLIEGAGKGERGVLFTLEETPRQLRRVAAGLGWDLEELEAKELITICYTSPVELSTDRFLFMARELVKEKGAKRAVFDSLTTMALGIPSERRFKEMAYAIAKHMRAAGVSLMMTVESPQLLGSAQLTGQGVSFVADNLILLRYVELGGKLERAISVLKARGVKHNSELRALTVQKGGVQVSAGRYSDLRGVLTGVPSNTIESKA